jgi:hypothetical protein
MTDRLALTSSPGPNSYPGHLVRRHTPDRKMVLRGMILQKFGQNTNLLQNMLMTHACEQLPNRGWFFLVLETNAQSIKLTYEAPRARTLRYMCGSRQLRTRLEHF